MNRGVEIDPRVADSRRRADRDAGARRARRRAWRCSTTCSRTGPIEVKTAIGRWRWRDAVREGRRRRRTSSSAARASSTRSRRSTRVLDVRVDDGVIAAARRRASTRTAHRVVDGRGPRARAGVRRPARAPAHAGPRGRGDDRLRHGRRGRGRLLRDPRDAEHRAGRRLRRDARLADRDSARRGRDSGRLPRRDHEGPVRARS